MNNKKEITVSKLAEGVIDINNAMIALSYYVDDNISDSDVTLEAIGGLNGLIKAILVLSNKVTDGANELRQGNSVTL